MRILDLKFLKFGLNFEMLTWTFPKSQNLPNLKIFSQNLGKSTSAFQNLTQISEISNPKFSQNLSAQLQLLMKLHPVACCVCRALSWWHIKLLAEGLCLTSNLVITVPPRRLRFYIGIHKIVALLKLSFIIWNLWYWHFVTHKIIIINFTPVKNESRISIDDMANVCIN